LLDDENCADVVPENVDNSQPWSLLKP
jgi:hypothetical protein